MSDPEMTAAEAIAIWCAAREDAANICDHWANVMLRRLDDPALTTATRDAAMVQEPILRLCAAAIMAMEPARMTPGQQDRAQAALDAAVAGVLGEPRIRAALMAAATALLTDPADYEARYAEAIALITEYQTMTDAENKTWRAGYKAAEEKWFSAVLRGVYRCHWGENKGRWCSGIIGDEPVYPELEALLVAFCAANNPKGWQI